MTSLLSTISGPEHLKTLDMDQLEQICRDLREKIIATVADTGGHLGASLGVVELTVALHRVYASPTDKLIWDVGHQAYGHKLLTGRYDGFDTLRQQGGVSGFPKRSESEHDMFGVGHASTSISAALGFAKARDIRGEDNRVVAIIGDGALTGGLAYEGLNNAGQIQSDLIVILNDNEMSISPNVGAVAKHLTRITSGRLYNRFESDLWKILGKFPNGSKAQILASRIKEGLKQIVVPAILFEELGFKYFGPIDGHDLPVLISTLESIRRFREPILIHVVTRKGKGYAFAEQERSKYHGVGRFDKDEGVKPSKPGVPTYTKVFSDAILEEAERDPSIVAITAAMPEGTGLDLFRDRYPDRFFDVGIAEGHAVTFAGGLACAGMRPVVALYSTFLQRAYDQLIHDIALQKLPVVFAIDRGGLVGEDGPTHHGVFDLSYLRVVPNLVVMAPKDEQELKHMIHTALCWTEGPVAIRYPRGAGVGVPLTDRPRKLPVGKAETVRTGSRVCLLAIGTAVQIASDAADRMADEGLDPTVVNMRFLKPLDEAMLERVFSSYELVLTLEENAVIGGLYGAVSEWAVGQPDLGVPIRPIGVPDRFMQHASRRDQLEEIGLFTSGILDVVNAELSRSDTRKESSASG